MKEEETIVLREFNPDWFALETEYSGIGLSMKDLITVARICTEKMHEKGRYLNYER